MTSPNVAQNESEIEEVLQKYSELEGRLPVLFGCPDSALEESLFWLLSIQSYLTELRLIMPHLDSDLQLNMEIKLREIATVLHNLQEQRRVRVIS